MVVNLKLRNKEQVRFTKRLESRVHCEFMKHTGMDEGIHKFLDECRASSINGQRLLLGNSYY